VHVGTAVSRPDGAAKVEGRALYVADLRVAGALVAATVRSPVAHGFLRGITWDLGFDRTAVTVVGAADVPGDNVVALIADDQPVLVPIGGVVRHVGDPVLLLAAASPELLRAAAAAVRLDVEPLPAEFDADAAGEVLQELAIDKGDPDAAFAHADLVVEGDWRTDGQEQMYIEPQGCIAWPADPRGVVEVVGSLQCPFYVQRALCRALALPPDRVRVVQAVTGGGFGGKEEYPSVVACHAALLARASGRPVRLLYDRHEDLAVTPKRHPSRVRHKTALARDGTVLAMDIDVRLDGGAYTTLSPVVLSRAILHATGPYRCEHVRIRGRVVRTNVVPYGAFRGFGAPQTCFAVERQMDRIARTLGIHPVELRRKNLLREGDTTATGQVLRTSVGSRAVLQRICAATGVDRHAWRAPRQGRVRSGVGFAFFFHGAGFTGSGEEKLSSRVRVRLLGDGRVEVGAASTEIGQGTSAMLQAIAADALGSELDDVVLAAPDTAQVPDSGPTVASRTCMIVGALVARACARLRAQLDAAPAPSFRARARASYQRAGGLAIEEAYAPPPGVRFDDATYRGDAYPVYGWAADVVEVEVDTDTFAVRVVGFTTCVDVGKAIHPLNVEGQIEGGSLQALGFGHLEVVDAPAGRFRQDRMATCIVPTSLDAPPMRVLLVEVPYPFGPFGAKGVGELPMDGGAPALVAAIEDALGLEPEHIPATPERLLAAWLAAHPDEDLEADA